MSERIVPLFQVNGKKPVQPACPAPGWMSRVSDVQIQYNELEHLLCDELTAVWPLKLVDLRGGCTVVRTSSSWPRHPTGWFGSGATDSVLRMASDRLSGALRLPSSPPSTEFTSTLLLPEWPASRSGGTESRAKVVTGERNKEQRNFKFLRRWGSPDGYARP